MSGERAKTNRTASRIGAASSTASSKRKRRWKQMYWFPQSAFAKTRSGSKLNAVKKSETHFRDPKSTTTRSEGVVTGTRLCTHGSCQSSNTFTQTRARDTRLSFWAHIRRTVVFGLVVEPKALGRVYLRFHRHANRNRSFRKAVFNRRGPGVVRLQFASSIPRYRAYAGVAVYDTCVALPSVHGRRNLRGRRYIRPVGTGKRRACKGNLKSFPTCVVSGWPLGPYYIEAFVTEDCSRRLWICVF